MRRTPSLRRRPTWLRTRTPRAGRYSSPRCSANARCASERVGRSSTGAREEEEEEEGAERARTRRAPARGGNNGDDDPRAAGARDDEVDETPTAATGARTEPTNNGDDDDDDDEPMCRICFGGEEEGAKGADRLFAPCQCRGSQGLVHVRCLNQWRARSRNNASYFECNTCHYRYHLERAAWAGRLEDPRVLAATSGCVVLFAVLSVGVVVRVTATRALVPLFARLAALAERAGVTGATLNAVANLGTPRPSHGWRDSVRAAYAACGTAGANSAFFSRLSKRRAEGGAQGGHPLDRARRRVAASLGVCVLPRRGVAAAVVVRRRAGRVERSLPRSRNRRPARRRVRRPTLGSWRRRWWWWWSPRHCAGDVADALDTVVAGLVVLGFAAFGWNLGTRLRGKLRFNLEHLLPLAMMVSSHGARTARLIVHPRGGGRVHEVYRAVRVWSKELLTRFGERVLEVRPRPG